jgi:hypothetical protein
MPPDTVDDDVYASLRALLPVTAPARPTKTKPSRGGKFGPQAPSRRRYKKPIERTTTRPQAEALLVKKGAPPGPCAGCRHADRCREGLACEALRLFVQTGRVSAYAPRQPRRDLFLRLYPAAV